MQVKTEQIDDTHIRLTIEGEIEEFNRLKNHVLKELGSKRGNIPGFRQGKAPLELIEKQLDPSLVQTEFLEHAVNDFFIKAINQENIRAVSQPNVEIKKFVPFETLEFTAELEVIGKIKLADYKKVKVDKPKVSVAAKDVNDVLDQLALRAAKKQIVKRAAKEGDEVTIDFTGVDAKTREPIQGADGQDYDLALGSHTFIPGFEPKLIGMKTGETKTFDITFPKDYAVNALQSKQVSFTVTVKAVKEIGKPKVDDKFATQVGPFKSLTELKADIKKQLTQEREAEAERAYENDLILKVAEASKLSVPPSLIDEQVDRMEREERQNLVYRGQTWQEHLAEEGLTEEQHRQKNRQPAELRVKAGLVLTEIAEAEHVTVEPEELNLQIEAMKRQYPDEKMQAELDKPENRRDIMSRLLSQKTLAKLKTYQ